MSLQDPTLDGGTNPAPISTSSLIFPTASQSFSKTLTALKRLTLSISHRLSSIHHDSLFVLQTAAQYNLPLVANERCGSWYIPPERKVGSAYFKSTDGHQGQWSFSTRRLNLQILEVIGKHGGCIIVDSTRRGKSMPDALSKTIPIWCAVLNRLLFDKKDQTLGLYTPGYVVGRSEHSQIEARIDSFVSEANYLQLDLSALRSHLSAPIRPFFVTPNHPFPQLPPKAEAPYLPIICLTASRHVHGTENSEDNYIQGAGDDSEGWSHGLTPALFWRHKDTLMSTIDEALPSLIASLVSSEQTDLHSQPTIATLIRPTSSIYVGSLASIHSGTWDAVICCNMSNPFLDPMSSDNAASTERQPRVLHLPTPQGKLGSRALRTHLHLLPPFLDSLVRNPIQQQSKQVSKILFTCPTGTDLAVGTALVALCLSVEDHGSMLDSQANGNKHAGMEIDGEVVKDGCKIDKTLIRRRLAWITTAKPDARPSRETLQAVNTCLIGR
ncbi:MAG: hypothetical protein Q9213_007090 [Squamulea squamosa]